jgi:transposase InsO family protein
MTPGGNKYFLSFTDDFSRCSTIQLLKHKNQAPKAIEAYVTMAENQYGKTVKIIRTDRGGEFWNKKVEEFCREKGIIHQKTNPYSSQENGIAERLNKSLMEKARSMLEDAFLEKKFWGEAVMTANYVRNRTVSSVHGKTPFELSTGSKPGVDHLRVFGCKAFSHVPAQKRQKLDPVAEEGVFLGYEPGTKGYRILRAKDGKVFVSKDVTFKEDVY